MSKLSLPQKLLQELIEHAREGYPHEVVGILAGNRTTNTVDEVKVLLNERANTTNRYKVSPIKLMKAERQLEEQGHEIIGYYHSHPDHTAQYSDYDRVHALPNMSYLILSIQNGSYSDALSWRLKEDRTAMTPETLILT